MTFTELCAEVYILTRRPDLVAVTESAVKSATLTAHHSDYYPKDMFASGVNLGESLYIHDFDYRALFPLYRAFKFLRKYDYANSTPGGMIELILPEQVFSRYGIQKPDICYVAGAYLHINSGTPEQYFILGAYANPNITSTGFSSWIALDNPYVIVYGAAAVVFKTIGKDEESATYRQLVAEQITLLRTTSLVAEGF